MRTILVWTAYLLLTLPAVLAQSTPEDLRKIAGNPFADNIKLSFEEDFTFRRQEIGRMSSAADPGTSDYVQGLAPTR